ncbi:LacI family DNA-binding transcriptional regulator [Streptomyces sp. NPDC026672]|uniref:LacI family DNA-binding transcriptional regulator n=1 Tax=unclassified Streptomyces TaxID=2593676 RepID=UPI00340E9FDA
MREKTAQAAGGAGAGSPTIKDIAELAGVTAGTVSRVVNGRPGVGAATRARIEKLVAEHGYRINSSARQLSTGRSHTIAMVFPQHASEVVMHPVYPELLGAVGDAAEAADHDLLLVTVAAPDKLERAVDAMIRRRIDGAILPAAGSRDRVRTALSKARIPTVTIGHRTTVSGSAWVDTTHDLAAEELTARLIRAGYRRLHMLNGPEHVSACVLRSRGFWRAVEDAGGAVEDAGSAVKDDGSTVEAAGGTVEAAEESHVPFDTAPARDAALDLLSARLRPTAVVAGSDLIASAVLDAARQLSLRVPEDLAVTGFDDQTLARHTTPQLTTVRAPLREIGAAAVRILLAEIGNTSDRRRRILLPAEVVVRQSTPPGY